MDGTPGSEERERKPCPIRSQERSRAGCRRAGGPSPSASAPSCSLRSCSWSTWIATAPASVAGTPRRRCSSRSSSSRLGRRARSSRPTRCTRRRRFPPKEVEVGAVADPAYLAGRAAAVDIFPGQQITSTDFAASDTDFRRLADHWYAARVLDLDRQRPRVALAGAGRRLGRRLHLRGRRREALRAERQGAHDSSSARPERWLEPRAPHRDRRGVQVGSTRPTTRS